MKTHFSSLYTFLKKWSWKVTGHVIPVTLRWEVPYSMCLMGSSIIDSSRKRSVDTFEHLTFYFSSFTITTIIVWKGCVGVHGKKCFKKGRKRRIKEWMEGECIPCIASLALSLSLTQMYSRVIWIDIDSLTISCFLPVVLCKFCSGNTHIFLSIEIQKDVEERGSRWEERRN